MILSNHQTCDFCSQIAGRNDHNAIQPILRTNWSRRPVLAESCHAVVMPSIGALASGHVLVCPKKHVRSVAAAGTEIGLELMELAAATQQRLQSRSGCDVHAFEHGSSARGSAVACSVEHAHLHLVPANVDIRDRLLGIAAWTPAVNYPEQFAWQTEGAEYLLYGAPTGERWLATTHTGFASQLLRRVLADALGIGRQWNWRVQPASERMRATVELLATPALDRALDLQGATC